MFSPVKFFISLFRRDTKNIGIKEIDSYKNVKERLRGVENEALKPMADIEGLDIEVNNGGFNQYFFNSPGQNCFETLRELKKQGKFETAAILEQAINLINPNKLSEDLLINNLRKRIVAELDDDKVGSELNKLDEEYYKYPDGPLTEN
jgi:hypothetical protein